MENMDKRLGAYISRTSARSSETECPPEAVLSAFIEGTLRGRDRKEMMDHLNLCEGCRNQVVDVLAVEEMLGDELQVKSVVELKARDSLLQSVTRLILHGIVFLRFLRPGQQFAIAVPLALAILVIAIHFGMPYTPPGFSDMMAHFEDDRPSAQSGYTLPKPIMQKQFMGFHRGLSMERAVFRIGVLSSRLKLSLRAENGKNAQAQLISLISLIQSIKIISHLTVEFEGFEDDVRAGRFSTSLISMMQQLEEDLNDDELLFYLRFGQWVQAGEIAAANQKAAFFDPQTVAYYYRKAVHFQIPRGVINGLDQMQSIIRQGTPDRFGFKMLEKSAQEIIRILI